MSDNKDLQSYSTDCSRITTCCCIFLKEKLHTWTGRPQTNKCWPERDVWKKKKDGQGFEHFSERLVTWDDGNGTESIETEEDRLERTGERDYLHCAVDEADRLTVAGSINQFVAFCDPALALKLLLSAVVSFHAFVYIIVIGKERKRMDQIITRSPHQTTCAISSPLLCPVRCSNNKATHILIMSHPEQAYESIICPIRLLFFFPALR